MDRRSSWNMGTFNGNRFLRGRGNRDGHATFHTFDRVFKNQHRAELQRFEHPPLPRTAAAVPTATDSRAFPSFNWDRCCCGSSRNRFPRDPPSITKAALLRGSNNRNGGPFPCQAPAACPVPVLPSPTCHPVADFEFHDCRAGRAAAQRLSHLHRRQELDGLPFSRDAPGTHMT